MYKAKIYVTLKKSVFDPQGETVLSALHSMNFDGAKTMRVGRYFEMDVEAGSEGTAKAQVEKMCNSLLVNPVIEDYSFELKEC
ncbi:MAG: phosphoribosylformylglycinamidine synthase subunit PurS [Candidatus Omnitrophica bacterium]|nr:phosphoribosylformylglycinamidine synthase subunit PurS [Candidatus Omnitrophota bacterium]